MKRDSLIRESKRIRQGSLKLDGRFKRERRLRRIMAYTVAAIFSGVIGFALYIIMLKPLYLNGELIKINRNVPEWKVGTNAIVTDTKYTYYETISYLSNKHEVSLVKIETPPYGIANIDGKFVTLKQDEYAGICITGSCEKNKVIKFKKEQLQGVLFEQQDV